VEASIQPNERPTGLMVFTQGHEPTYEQLAAEALQLARLGIFRPPSLLGKLRYRYSAWTLKRVGRWQHAANWTAVQVFRRITVGRWAIVLFWPLAVVVLVQAIGGRFNDPVDLLLVLLVLMLLSVFFGLLFTAGWRARLQGELAWAEAYRRNRLQIEHQLFSPQGYGGWKGVRKPDGSYTLIAVEDPAGAA
jgi:hypothetical protein